LFRRDWVIVDLKFFLTFLRQTHSSLTQHWLLALLVSALVLYKPLICLLDWTREGVVFDIKESRGHRTVFTTGVVGLSEL
jgi:hypothetical protein